MKIAIILDKGESILKGNPFGAEKFALEVGKNLAEKKHEVWILSDYESPLADISDRVHLSKITTVKNKYFRKLCFDYYNPISYNSIKKKLDEIQPDIVHVNNFYGVGMRTLKKLSETYPIVITAHDYWLVCYRATMFLEDKIVCDGKNCKCHYPLSLIHNHFLNDLKDISLIAPSKYLAQKLKESGRFSKVFHIPNGIDIPKETTDYSKNIVFVGRITKEKGLQTVINSLNEVKSYKKLILGEGPLKDELKSKYNNVEFLGFKNPKDYYLHSSIMIIPSIWPENFSYTVLEAMSRGLCVIGAKVGGILEQIKHMETGLLFEAGNEEDFKKQLDYLVKNQKEVVRMGKNAREFVKKNFAWSKIVRKYETIYFDLIQEFKKK